MAGGAAITVITKSGTNEFKGSAFELYNNEKLNATPYFATEKRPAHAHIVEPCVLEHRLESLGITKTIDSVHQSCSLSTDVSLQPSSQGMMPWTALNSAPHSDGEATAWNEHAVRLS